MSDQAHPIDLVFRIAPTSNMIEATGVLLRERVEITAQSIEMGTISGRAAPPRIERLRNLAEFAAVEADETVQTDPPYAAAIVTLWGWSSSIRITPTRPARRIIQRMMG